MKRHKKLFLLDLRKTSLPIGSSRSDSKVLLSAGRVSIDTLTAEKEVLDTSGESRGAGILGKSSIVIDARNSGTSTGRYTDKLIEYLHKLDSPYVFTIVTRRERLGFFNKIAPSFDIAVTTYTEFTLGEQIGFKKQLRSLKPDLVHFPIVQQPIFYRGRVVTSMLDLTTLKFRNPAKNPVIFTLKQFVYRFVNIRAARKSVAIICISNFVKDRLIKFAVIPPSKVTTTYLAADKITDSSVPLKELEKKKFIMYVGRPQPHKNLRRLIDAFKLLQINDPELVLALIGKKDVVYEQHRSYAQRAGIKNVIQTGLVSEGQLRWLYENTACYVFPSLSEGFGLPGLEAMVHGAPVASSNATCLPEVYGDAAEYFDPYSVEAIAASVNKVLTDTKRADELRILGKNRAARYSWQRMAEQTLVVYEKALSEK